MDPRDRETERRAALARILERLAVDPASAHLEEALTHPSYTNEHKGPANEAPADNQRLEFLGDSVLGLCVSEILMTTLVGVDEGQLTMMRASLVNANVLAEVALEHELDQALRLGRGADSTGERQRPNVLADALEALVGCVYLDGGLDASRRLVSRLLAEKLEKLVAVGGAERDAKSRLQELLQSRGLPPPRYRVVAEKGPPHAREFCVEAQVSLPEPLAAISEPDDSGPDGKPRWTVTASGQGRSKKLAEQAAASDALEILRR
jgi:ribonuclease-3